MAAKKHIGSAVVISLGAIGGVFQFFPDAMIWAWHTLPDDLKQSLPPVAVKWISYSIFMLSVVARLWPRKGKEDDRPNSA